ncbi:MAG: putative lipid II flippase FtsW [SAR86 cluster bacterium]|jgi:cell division protein FtsW|nr:putative lipid II flippase FtsW [SAR86 cluster bacterium]
MRKRIHFIDLDKIDFVIISLFITLTSCGLLAIASSSITYSDLSSSSSLDFLIKQSVHLIIGLVALFIILSIKISFWEKTDRVFLATGIFLLVLVLIPSIGTEVNGASRWIRFGSFSLQPSEIMKFISIIYISGYSARRLTELRNKILGFMKPAFLIVLVTLLILLQPDLGSSAVLFLTVLGILFVAGVPLMQFMVIISLGFTALFSLIIFVPWRWERVISFMDPWNDKFDTGYQLTQSLMAIGRGDWFGKGIGESVIKMGYLPEAHTDFIFSIIVEEMGLIFALFLILLLFILVFRCFRIANDSKQKGLFFSSFISYGVGILIGLHTFINVGVASGLLPTKGLTLPFISYGGNNLIVMCALLGLILRIDYENKESMPSQKIIRKATYL